MSLGDKMWFHRMRGHTITHRAARASDNCLTHTFTFWGKIVPIYLDVCSCGRVW